MRSLASETRTVAGEGPSEARRAVGDMGEGLEARRAVGDMGEGLDARRSVGMGSLCSADGLVVFGRESIRESIHSLWDEVRLR